MIKFDKLTDETSNELSQFLVSLAVGQVVHTETVLKSLVKKFMPGIVKNWIFHKLIKN